MAIGEIAEQPREQHAVHAGRHREKQIGFLRGHGAARIDHHDPGAALALVLHHALEQHRMAPGGVGAGEHDQVGEIEIGIGAGHGVGAEGALVARDRRGHAEPGIGVDIGRAEKALHQLVGDVIILGQQLAGEIEGDRVGSVALDDAAKAVRRPYRARSSSRCEHTRRRSAAASDAAAAYRARASRRVPSPSSTACRNSPDDRDRPKSSRRPGRRARRARRSRHRNRGRWCG